MIDTLEGMSADDAAAWIDMGFHDESARSVAATLVKRGIEHEDAVALGFAGIIHALLNVDDRTMRVEVGVDDGHDIAKAIESVREPLDALAKALLLR
ncbi:hypothetical protein [Streptomyces noursei]